jgi:hypothetical protein
MDSDTWVPASCTLPVAERPLRAAGFDALFAAAVRGVTRVDPDRIRLKLRADAGVAGWVAELMVAEVSCCAFFTFSLIASDGALALEIGVPEDKIPMLDAIAARAAGA